MFNNITIMIVEDDQILANEIKGSLVKWKYKVAIVSQFNDILQEFKIYKPQLVLMDINLPYFDGFYWCDKIRQISEIPVIYISSRNDDKDKIMAIAQGGDDYVEKPFNLNLLRAKIEAVVRRTYHYKVNERVYLEDNFYFDYGSSTLLFNNQVLDITKSEKKIIAKLIENKSLIVTRDELMMELWNTDEYISDGTLTVMISRLRNKMKEFYGKDIIRTKKGQGYYIE